MVVKTLLSASCKFFLVVFPSLGITQETIHKILLPAAKTGLYPLKHHVVRLSSLPKTVPHVTFAQYSAMLIELQFFMIGLRRAPENWAKAFVVKWPCITSLVCLVQDFIRNENTIRLFLQQCHCAYWWIICFWNNQLAKTRPGFHFSVLELLHLFWGTQLRDTIRSQISALLDLPSLSLPTYSHPPLPQLQQPSRCWPIERELVVSSGCHLCMNPPVHLDFVCLLLELETRNDFLRVGKLT